MTNTENQTSTGYICKACGTASPMGIGYAVQAVGARQASSSIKACQCGRSTKTA